MSHKGNDSYLEELEIAEQDFKDSQEAYDNAREETRKAHEWEVKMRNNYFQQQERLQTLRNKE